MSELVLPRNRDLERSLLGACLKSLEDYEIVRDIVHTDEVFFDHGHRKLWECMRACYEHSGAMDIHLVYDEVRARGFTDVLTPVDMRTILTSVATSAYAEMHAERLVRIWQARESLKVVSEAREEIAAMEDGWEGVITETRETLDRIMLRGNTSHVVEANTLMDVVTERGVNHSAERSESESTGLVNLDKYIGLAPGILIGLAGRPSLGKTALATTIARTVLRRGERVIWFPYEMPAEEMVARMVCAEANVSYHLYHRGQMTGLDTTKFSRGVEKVNEYPWEIATAAMTGQDVERHVMRSKARHGSPRLVVVDYLQLMPLDCRPQGTSERSAALGDIVLRMKRLSIRAGTTVLLLSQLSREAEKEREPRLGMLAQSAGQEASFDVAAFLWDMKRQDAEGINQVDVWLMKNRQGPTAGQIGLEMDQRTMMFATRETASDAVKWTGTGTGDPLPF